MAFFLHFDAKIWIQVLEDASGLLDAATKALGVQRTEGLGMEDVGVRGPTRPLGDQILALDQSVKDATRQLLDVSSIVELLAKGPARDVLEQLLASDILPTRGIIRTATDALAAADDTTRATTRTTSDLLAVILHLEALELLHDGFAHHRRGGEAIVRGVRQGASSYRAALVARADSALTLTTLDGSRAVWADRDSVGGYLLPMALLRDKGLDANKLFSSQRFAG
jgi:hypothetical protein